MQTLRRGKLWASPTIFLRELSLFVLLCLLILIPFSNSVVLAVGHSTQIDSSEHSLRKLSACADAMRRAAKIHGLTSSEASEIRDSDRQGLEGFAIDLELLHATSRGAIEPAVRSVFHKVQESIEAHEIRGVEALTEFLKVAVYLASDKSVSAKDLHTFLGWLLPYYVQTKSFSFSKQKSSELDLQVEALFQLALSKDPSNFNPTPWMQNLTPYEEGVEPAIEARIWMIKVLSGAFTRLARTPEATELEIISALETANEIRSFQAAEIRHFIRGSQAHLAEWAENSTASQDFDSFDAVEAGMRASSEDFALLNSEGSLQDEPSDSVQKRIKALETARGELDNAHAEILFAMQFLAGRLSERAQRDLGLEKADEGLRFHPSSQIFGQVEIDLRELAAHYDYFSHLEFSSSEGSGFNSADFERVEHFLSRFQTDIAEVHQTLADLLDVLIPSVLERGNAFDRAYILSRSNYIRESYSVLATSAVGSLLSIIEKTKNKTDETNKRIHQQARALLPLVQPVIDLGQSNAWFWPKAYIRLRSGSNSLLATERSFQRAYTVTEEGFTPLALPHENHQAFFGLATHAADSTAVFVDYVSQLEPALLLLGAYEADRSMIRNAIDQIVYPDPMGVEDDPYSAIESHLLDLEEAFAFNRWSTWKSPQQRHYWIQRLALARSSIDEMIKGLTKAEIEPSAMEPEASLLAQDRLESLVGQLEELRKKSRQSLSVLYVGAINIEDLKKREAVIQSARAQNIYMSELKIEDRIRLGMIRKHEDFVRVFEALTGWKSKKAA